MKSLRTGLLELVVSTCVITLGATQTFGMCCPIPCDGCWIESAGQLNLVVMDRGAGEIQLVPNIRLMGQAQDFALVVPTPSVPMFGMAPATVWRELAQLTAPVAAESGGSGCGSPTTAASPRLDTGAEDAGVGVIVEETVGAFRVTVLEATDPAALLDWLVANDFPLDGADAALFAPYIERQWVFTAMKLDPALAPMPTGGWNTNVEPVRMTYAAEEFELALPLMSINRAASMPVAVYVVDDHRTTLDGFDTLYANRLTTSEHRAIVDRYPGMKGFVAPGRWITRLDRSFTSQDAMDTSVYLERARTDLEFRRVFPVRGAVSIESLVAAFGIAALLQRARRRRAMSA